MRTKRSDGDLPRWHLRNFAWVLALILAVFAWQQASFPWARILQLIAALIFAIGTVLPGTFRRPHRAMLFILTSLRSLASRITTCWSRLVRSVPPPVRSTQAHDKQPASGLHR